MARCGCGTACACSVQAGDGVNVTGNGSPGNPYTIEATGGALVGREEDCIEVVVTGTGTDGDPYIASAVPIIAAAPNGLQCTEGGLLVRPSADNDNGLGIGSDGRLYVGAGASTVETDCGLLGDGSVGDPVRANVATWTAPCPQGANQGPVYCDPVTGQLGTNPDLPVQRVDMFNLISAGNQVVVPANGFPSQGSGLTDMGVPVLDSLTNDTCCDMTLYVQAGVNHAQWAKDGNGRSQHQMFGRLDLTGDVVGTSRGHVRYGATTDTGILMDVQDAMGDVDVYTLPAGGTVNLSLIGQFDNEFNNGDTRVANFSVRAQITAIPNNCL